MLPAVMDCIMFISVNSFHRKIFMPWGGLVALVALVRNDYHISTAWYLPFQNKHLIIVFQLKDWLSCYVCVIFTLVKQDSVLLIAEGSLMFSMWKGCRNLVLKTSITLHAKMYWRMKQYAHWAYVAFVRMSCDITMRLRKPPSMPQINSVEMQDAVCGQRKMLRPVSEKTMCSLCSVCE